MIWGVSRTYQLCYETQNDELQWVTGSVALMFIGMSLGELASAAPTSGGVRITCSSPTNVLIVFSAILLDTFVGVSTMSKPACLGSRL
jgi:hypothetical protein